MDISFSSLAAGFIFGVIGLYILKQGRTQAHVEWIVIGLTLMIYPYFIASIWLLWLTGVALVWIAYVRR